MNLSSSNFALVFCYIISTTMILTHKSGAYALHAAYSPHVWDICENKRNCRPKVNFSPNWYIGKVCLSLLVLEVWCSLSHYGLPEHCVYLRLFLLLSFLEVLHYRALPYSLLNSPSYTYNLLKCTSTHKKSIVLTLNSGQPYRADNLEWGAYFFSFSSMRWVYALILKY